MAVIDAYARTAAPDDPRGIQQRRADALVDIVVRGGIGPMPGLSEDLADRLNNTIGDKLRDTLTDPPNPPTDPPAESAAESAVEQRPEPPAAPQPDAQPDAHTDSTVGETEHRDAHPDACDEMCGQLCDGERRFAAEEDTRRVEGPPPAGTGRLPSGFCGSRCRVSTSASWSRSGPCSG